MAANRKAPRTYADVMSASEADLWSGFLERAGVRPTDSEAVIRLKVQARVAWIEARHKRLEPRYGGPEGYERFLKFLEAHPGMAVEDAFAAWEKR